MARSIQLGLALALAASLAGCSMLRTSRRSAPASDPAPPTATPHEKKMPKAETASVKDPPMFAPALFIPGSAADNPMPRRDPDPAATTTATLSLTSATETTLPPLTPTPPAPAEPPLTALHRKAAAKWAATDVYGCRMRRRELFAGKSRPEEVIAAKFRKSPFSVHFVWVGQEAKGRELVYVQGQHGNQIHTLTAAGDVPLLPAGHRFKVSPDSLLIKCVSRSSITDAGVGPLILQFGKLVDDLERGGAAAGAVKYLGKIKRTEFEHPVEVVLQKVLPGAEAAVSSGGQRLWCFDPNHGLPVLMVTHDDAGREIDFCCFDRFEFPKQYDDDVFHPDRLGKSVVASRP